jgi:adenosine kinase
MKKHTPLFIMTMPLHQQRIAIIGHLVWDRINYIDGGTIESFGGTAYNLAALASVADNSTFIFPVCYIGKNLIDKTKKYWGRFTQIDWSLSRVLDQNQEVHVLKYNKSGYRRENNLNLFPHISRANFKNCPALDIALINYIGGNEFPPASIRWLKEKYKPLIYLDYHSLALSRVSGYKRHFRRHPHWRRYLLEADIVQMNEFELETLFPGVVDSPLKISEAAREILHLGPRMAIITRENQDLVAAWRVGNLTKWKSFAIPKVPNEVDSTGCGDTYAAGFVYALSKGKDFEACCISGLKLAARKIAFSGPEGFFKKI